MSISLFINPLQPNTSLHLQEIKTEDRNIIKITYFTVHILLPLIPIFPILTTNIIPNLNKHHTAHAHKTTINR